jgi:hypothetical protein
MGASDLTTSDALEFFATRRRSDDSPTRTAIAPGVHPS